MKRVPTFVLALALFIALPQKEAAGFAPPPIPATICGADAQAVAENLAKREFPILTIVHVYVLAMNDLLCNHSDGEEIIHMANIAIMAVGLDLKNGSHLYQILHVHFLPNAQVKEYSRWSAVDSLSGESWREKWCRLVIRGAYPQENALYNC